VNKKKIATIIWWIYLVLLFVVVIVKFRGSVSDLVNRIQSVAFGAYANPIPFNTIRIQWQHISEGWAQFNLLGNIVPFAPIGFLLPVVFDKLKSFLPLFLTSLGIIVFFELFQLVTKLGSCDIDDVILNMLGVVIGYLVLKVVKRR
jgi:Glycopeptide antibiotics resistance protein